MKILIWNKRFLSLWNINVSFQLSNLTLYRDIGFFKDLTKNYSVIELSLLNCKVSSLCLRLLALKVLRRRFPQLPFLD